MRVLIFQPRFVAPVRAGAKVQTIRRRRRLPTLPGDVLSLRAWEGKPYRSPQRAILPPVVCASAVSVRVETGFGTYYCLAVFVGGERLTHSEAGDFARADGFRNAADMVFHYREVKRVESFDGELIGWVYPGGPRDG